QQWTHWPLRPRRWALCVESRPCTGRVKCFSEEVLFERTTSHDPSVHPNYLPADLPADYLAVSRLIRVIEKSQVAAGRLASPLVYCPVVAMSCCTCMI
ncbi:unnamed protein product, partial [Mycena citricolor]